MVTANSSYVFAAFKNIDISNQDGDLVSTRYSYRTTILSTPHVSPVSPPCLDSFLWTKLCLSTWCVRVLIVWTVNHHHILLFSFFVGVYVCRFFCCLELCFHERYRLFVFPLGLQCLFRAGCQDMVSMFVSNKQCFRGVYVFHSGTQKKTFCAVLSHMIAPQGRQTHAYCLSELLLSESGCSFN